MEEARGEWEKKLAETEAKHTESDARLRAELAECQTAIGELEKARAELQKKITTVKKQHKETRVNLMMGVHLDAAFYAWSSAIRMAKLESEYTAKEDKLSKDLVQAESAREREATLLAEREESAQRHQSELEAMAREKEYAKRERSELAAQVETANAMRDSREELYSSEMPAQRKQYEDMQAMCKGLEDKEAKLQEQYAKQEQEMATWQSEGQVSQSALAEVQRAHDEAKEHLREKAGRLAKHAQQQAVQNALGLTMNSAWESWLGAIRMQRLERRYEATEAASVCVWIREVVLVPSSARSGQHHTLLLATCLFRQCARANTFHVMGPESLRDSARSQVAHHQTMP